MTQLNFEQILKQAKSLKANGGGNFFKFVKPGDAFVAKFIGRRFSVQTKNGTATVLDIEIMTAESAGSRVKPGPYSVFESGLGTGNLFVLKLDAIDPQSGWKSFALKIVESSRSEPLDYAE